MTRVGMWYTTGPTHRLYVQGDPAFSRYEVISDASSHDGCVTVRNEANQTFPVAADLIDLIAGPAGEQPHSTKIVFADHHDSVAQGTVLDSILRAPSRRAFFDIVQLVAAKTSKHEAVIVESWTSPLVYIGVRDYRWKHYPCGHRFLVSFDLQTGDLYSGSVRYAFARKGWGSFADRLVLQSVPRYKDCGQPENKGYC